LAQTIQYLSKNPFTTSTELLKRVLNFVYLFLKNRRNAPQPLAKLDTLPRVTVQLPIFNELYVVERLLDETLGPGWNHYSLLSNISYPDCYPQGLHQDQNFIAPHRMLEGPPLVNAIYVLQDVDEVNGGTLIIPGSHRTRTEGDFYGPLPPTINLEALDPGCQELGLDFCAHGAVEKKIDHALSNSFGFGGTNASLVFSRWRG
jgi:hypothetical protein